jgi:hypothetical protein
VLGLAAVGALDARRARWMAAGGVAALVVVALVLWVRASPSNSRDGPRRTRHDF